MIDMWSLQKSAEKLQARNANKPIIRFRSSASQSSTLQSFNSKTIALPSAVIPSAEITTCLHEELL